MSPKGKLSKFVSDRLPAQEVKNSYDWVIFGEDPDWENQYPQYLESLSRQSSKNGAILKQKDRYVYGNGFVMDKSPLNRPEDKGIALLGFINKITEGRTFKRLISDRNKYGGFAAEMIYSKDGKKVVPHYLPFKNIRVSKDTYNKQGEKEPTKYYYTSDWSKRKQATKNPDFEVFDEFDWEEENPSAEKRYIVYFKDEGFEDSYYPLPDYQGGVPYIDADTEVGNFVYNNVKNGFTGGFFVEFYDGEPTQDQKRDIENMFQNHFHGTENAGKSVLNFADQAGDSTKITPLTDNGQDDRYINLNNQIREEVFTAHTVSPLVVGMKGENGFSNNADEKRVAVETFKSDFVHAAQEPFNDFMNQILRFNDISGKVYLEDLEPIKGEASETTLLQIATTDELRKLYGFNKQTLESNPVADAIGTISPLVATKVLDNMSVAEIRSLVGLNTTNGVEKITEKVVNSFSNEMKDEIILKFLEETGTPDEELEILYSRELFAKDIADAEMQSIAFKNEKFATPTENKILALLFGNPNLEAKEIADILGLEEQEVEDIISKLKEDGELNEDNTPVEEPEDEIFTVYKYEKRSDVSGASVKDTTRPFCRRLVAQSAFKSWTLEDIKRMNNGMGLDVFASRGGWRTIEGTDRHVPFCRHVWKSMLVRRKPQ